MGAVSNLNDAIPTAPQSRTRPSTIGLPSWITPALMVATQEAWTPIYGYPITEQEAIEIIQTFDRLTTILED